MNCVSRVDVGMSNELSGSAAARMDAHRLVQAVRYLNKAAYGGEGQGSGSTLTVAYDDRSQRSVVSVVVESTGQVLYQLPSEEVLRMVTEYRRKLLQAAA